MLSTPDPCRLFVCSCVVFCAQLCAQVPPCPGSAATPEVEEGLSALKEERYVQAAEHFQAATQVDPSCATAWLYLGNAYMQQYVPGVDSPENLALAEKAREQFQKVVDQQPENQQAMESIASLYLSQKKLDDAKLWYEKLTVANPDNKVAFYSMAVIAWMRSYSAVSDARKKMGMKPEDPGPLAETTGREALRDKYLPGLQEGIDHLNRAIEIDGEYADAMTYMNLLYRQLADLSNTPDDYQENIARADVWVQKALEAKKQKAENQQ